MMMTLRPIFYALGLLMILLAAAMMVPAALNAAQLGTEWEPFILSSCMTGFLGVMMALAAGHTEKLTLGIREAFLMTVISWFAMCLFAALPFMLNPDPLSFTDALFESVSALTTTGSSVITNLNRASPGTLLWRSLLQWLGGIGIVVMAMTVLPILRIGGMQLYRTEFSDRSEKILPRASQIAMSILTIQAVLTCCSALALSVAGMKPLDAVCHAMSALATGGFSTVDTSIAFFDSASIEVILMISMILGSCPILLYIRAWHGQPKALWSDPQLRTFLTLLLIFSLFLTIWRWFETDHAITSCARESGFFVISFMTSSGFLGGYRGGDGTFPLMLALVLMCIGGCTGSTAGGIKVLRFQVLYSVARAQIAQLRRPHGVFIPHYEGRPIEEGITFSVMTFVVLYLLSVTTIAVALSLANLPFSTCLSASAAAVANVGVCADSVSSAVLQYAAFPSAAKWTLMMGMLLGRLEMLTIFVLLVPSFWRK